MAHMPVWHEWKRWESCFKIELSAHGYTADHFADCTILWTYHCKMAESLKSKKSTFVCLFVFHILDIQMNLTSSLNIEHSFLFLPPKAIIDGVFKMEEI